MKTKVVRFPILCIFFILAMFSCHDNKKSKLKKSDNKRFYEALTQAEKFEKTNQLDSAFYYYNLSKNVVVNDSSNNKPIYSLLLMADIQQTQNDYVGSEITATEAIGLLNKYSNQEYASSLYNILGMNYDNLFDFELAEKNYNLSLKLKNTNVEKLTMKNNIAVVAIDDLKYDKAKKLLDKLLTDKDIDKDLDIKASILGNMGYCLLKTNQPNSLEYFSKALEIKKQINVEYSLVASYMHLSEFYKSRNKNLELQYARAALQQAQKLNCPDEKLKAMEVLIANTCGNYSEKYFELNDSLKKARQQSKNQFAKIRFDSKKTVAENQMLKIQKAENDLKIETQKSKLFALTIIGILASFSAVFIFQFLLYHNKKSKLKATYLTETRISKKVHDELANDVFNAMSFAISQDLTIAESKEKLINSLDDVYLRTRDISRENSSIETGKNFNENLKEMLSQYNNQNLNIIINGIDVVKWNSVNENKKITTFRVLQELLINLKKHSSATICVISFKQIDKKIKINFNDNGVGARLDEKNSKNGLQNTVSRIQAINGTITFDTEPNKGFKVAIVYPE